MALVPAGDKLGIAIIIVGAVFGLLAIISVCLRLWAKRLLKASFESSDYACLLALFFSISLVASTVLTVIWGLGEDESDVSVGQLVTLAKGMFVGQILWIVSNTCVRASIIFLYISIFQVPKFRTFAYVLLGVNAAYFLAVTLQTIFICHPIQYNWDQSIVGGGCGNQKEADFVIGIFNILLDISTIITPMPMLWSLQMVRTKKLALSIIFGTGIIIVIITILRVHFIESISFQDTTKSYASVGVLAILEPLLGVVNACIPVLRPALLEISKKLSPRKPLIFDTGTGSWKASTGASAPKSDRNKSANTNHFQPLDDYSYPLEERAYVGVSSPGRGNKDGFDSENQSGGELYGTGIHVQRIWEVQKSV